MPRLLVECAQFVRHSRSLASMMPALLLSGAASLLVGVLLHAVAPDVVDAAGVPLLGWQEAWMTLWPLLFPLFYLASLVVRKARHLAAVRMTWQPGLGLAEIAAVSRQIDAGLGRPVLRGLKPRNDYLA
ncbi:hypothetical protein RY831_15845 [Noviherbaspirillum sp. CPCC 100848]|uniref:Uncharacterized protein n=1 Tax=Noviherbaspirillum album TaxID=3080276 RepID=A0ABU6JAF3_9BURK|nr:hypothetical protein [Noviherbaspirillum sp. CPCC 100848]MEC4720637.1 hypothetical protein [Noviherbaspirillum sp. CPCC 100848]